MKMKLFKSAILVVSVILTFSCANELDDPKDISAPGQNTIENVLEVISARDAAVWPFRSDSVWNLPVANTAVYETATSAKTLSLRNTGITVWGNYGDYSHPISYAKDTDPLASLVDRNDSSRSAYNVRVPIDASIAPGSDKHMHVVTPDKKFIHENWDVTRNSGTSYTVGRHEMVDLYGTGVGPLNGTRAYGGSAIGGLIRHYDIQQGVIRHAIAMALTGSQLYYSGGAPGYDAQGYGTSLGYVWPATEQDYAAQWNYSGVIPMGTYIVLDKGVDVGTLGLSWAGLILARALQDYGGYVTDTSGSFNLFYVENNGGTEVQNFVSALLGPDWTARDLNQIRKYLRIVSNNSASTPNGGTLSDTRRQALAPAIN